MSSLEKSSNAGETTRLDTARSSGSVTLTGQVDIASAEAKFNELAREFSRHSELEKPDADVEKGDVAENEGAFDLREYLTSSNDANDAAGIKHKHVGVTWENLQVDVMGGSDSKVSDEHSCHVP
jgi:ATP-binding cassette subfamily G (WHITE) protein 2 (SNQ2)